APLATARRLPWKRTLTAGVELLMLVAHVLNRTVTFHMFSVVGFPSLKASFPAALCIQTVFSMSDGSSVVASGAPFVLLNRIGYSPHHSKRLLVTARPFMSKTCRKSAKWLGLDPPYQ